MRSKPGYLKIYENVTSLKLGTNIYTLKIGIIHLKIGINHLYLGTNHLNLDTNTTYPQMI